MNLFINDIEALFIKRPNRFIIHVKMGKEEVICHCPNTGRMGELLYPGVKVILEKSTNSSRKTKYSVVAVYKGDLIVPITSVRANNVVEKIVIPTLFTNPLIKKEVTFQKSRFDFLVEDMGIKTFIEVKSCTLFLDDLAVFPDAPTSRGLKHLTELEIAISQGYKGMVIFVVFNPNAKIFSPNWDTDPKFSSMLKKLNNIIDIVPFKIGVSANGKLSFNKNESIIPIKYNDV